jgi:hypothetical protein
MDKEWWRKAKLVSVLSKHYRMVMFHYVGMRKGGRKETLTKLYLTHWTFIKYHDR